MIIATCILYSQPLYSSFYFKYKASLSQNRKSLQLILQHKVQKISINYLIVPSIMETAWLVPGTPACCMPTAGEEDGREGFAPTCCGTTTECYHWPRKLQDMQSRNDYKVQVWFRWSQASKLKPKFLVQASAESVGIYCVWPCLRLQHR